MACVFNLIKSYSYFIIVNLQYSVLLVNKRAVRRQIELSPSLHHVHLHLLYRPLFLLSQGTYSRRVSLYYAF